MINVCTSEKKNKEPCIVEQECRNKIEILTENDCLNHSIWYCGAIIHIYIKAEKCSKPYMLS